MGQGRWLDVSEIDANGCLRSLRAHAALDGVSWVQSGSVEIAVDQLAACYRIGAIIYSLPRGSPLSQDVVTAASVQENGLSRSSSKYFGLCRPWRSFRVGLLRWVRIGESGNHHAGIIDAHDPRIS